MYVGMPCSLPVCVCMHACRKVCVCACYLTLLLTCFSYSCNLFQHLFFSFPEHFCSFACYTDGMFQSKLPVMNNEVLSQKLTFHAGVLQLRTFFQETQCNTDSQLISSQVRLAGIKTWFGCRCK